MKLAADMIKRCLQQYIIKKAIAFAIAKAGAASNMATALVMDGSEGAEGEGVGVTKTGLLNRQLKGTTSSMGMSIMSMLKMPLHRESSNSTSRYNSKFGKKTQKRKCR